MKPSRIEVPKDLQPYDRTDLLWGIQFVLGWQYDRIVYEVPLSMACTTIGLVVIWPCIIAWVAQ